MSMSWEVGGNYTSCPGGGGGRVKGTCPGGEEIIDHVLGEGVEVLNEHVLGGRGGGDY